MSSATSSHVARKRSGDAKGALASSSSLPGGPKKAAPARSKRPLSRSASLTKGNLELHLGQLPGSRSVKEAAGDVRTVSHALEDALLSFESLGVEGGKTALTSSDSGGEGSGSGSGSESAPFLPITTIGDSIVCLARDEVLLRETLGRKHAAQLRKAAAVVSKDHYKYSLFAGEAPEEDGLEAAPALLELTPGEHIAIARSSILGNHLGLSNVSAVLSTRPARRGTRPAPCDSGISTHAGSKQHQQQQERQERHERRERGRAKRYDSEHSTILVYCDGRAPIFVPKLDFSCLPNFRKPRMYHQQVAKGHLKKAKHGKHGKGLIGFLSLKFGF